MNAVGTSEVFARMSDEVAYVRIDRPIGSGIRGQWGRRAAATMKPIGVQWRSSRNVTPVRRLYKGWRRTAGDGRGRARAHLAFLNCFLERDLEIASRKPETA